MIDKPYDQVGKAGIEANVEHYLHKEQRLNTQALAARQQREHWERALHRLDRNQHDDKE
jgi:hypothetical protein